MAHCSDSRPPRSLRGAGLRLSLIAATLCIGACASTPRSASAPSALTPPVPVQSADARPRFDAALKLMQSGDRIAARDAFIALNREYPALSGPLTNLGILYAQLGQRGEAMSALARATTLNPRNAVAQNWLGSLYREGGDFQRAEAAYRQAIAAQPDYAPAHRNLGVLYDVSLRRPADALPHYREAQRLAAKPAPIVTAWIRDLEQRVGVDVAGVSR